MVLVEVGKPFVGNALCLVRSAFMQQSGLESVKIVDAFDDCLRFGGNRFELPSLRTLRCRSIWMIVTIRSLIRVPALTFSHAVVWNSWVWGRSPFSCGSYFDSDILMVTFHLFP